MAYPFSSTSVNDIGDPYRGGVLFTLPREVRDEIYRHVFDGVFMWSDPPSRIVIRKREKRTAAKEKVRLSILRVSKAINFEASEIWLSESVFQFVPHFFSDPIIDLPAKLIDRMKNVKFNLHRITTLIDREYGVRMDYVREAVDTFTRAQAARQCLTLDFLYAELVVEADKIVGLILEACKKMKSFRTVIVQIDVGEVLSVWGDISLSKMSAMTSRTLDRIEKKTMLILEPLLGPAVKCCSDMEIRFTFHPLKYQVDRT